MCKDTYASIIFTYVPISSINNDNDDDDGDDGGSVALKIEERRMQEKLNAKHCKVVFFNDERELLINVVTFLINNEYLIDLLSLKNSCDAKEICSVLIGYNSWEYDYMFFVTRLVYFGIYDLAIWLMRFKKEPRFNHCQLSFDLMKHAISRYKAVIGSMTLANVSRYFGSDVVSTKGLSEQQMQQKMKFDAVQIRKLYFVKTEKERFDCTSALFDTRQDEGVNLTRVLLYNIQDCVAVYYLLVNINFIDTVILYAQHFLVPLVEASTNELIGLETKENCYSELEIMKIDDEKVYIGGLNSAISGHYTSMSVDFASFYPSIGCTFSLSMETMRIMTVRQLLMIFRDSTADIDKLMEVGILRVFYYEPEDSPFVMVRRRKKGQSTINNNTDNNNKDGVDNNDILIRGKIGTVATEMTRMFMVRRDRIFQRERDIG
ncbi:dnapol b [Lasius niger]|uniref:Dnapol b n=1 Tax=Lasius niger TaxID=67767 RepID=A0A0J7KU04_LASNI|nr:dnapol b [Lasius niger]